VPAESGAHPALGPASAPITIADYADFGCPSCQAWHRMGILNQIRAHYGDKIRFVWYDFPVITPQSPKAAEAARCAADPGKFWEYHDLLYLRAPAIGVDALKAYARELKLDSASFNQCLDAGVHQAAVERDLQDAFAHQFHGTPSFLINGQLLIGPPAFAVLQRRIDAILTGK
jgi:protein-disulfide isomerase